MNYMQSIIQSAPTKLDAHKTRLVFRERVEHSVPWMPYGIYSFWFWIIKLSTPSHRVSIFIAASASSLWLHRASVFKLFLIS